MNFKHIVLFQICKDTKFVSNSQPSSARVLTLVDCFRYAKIQNLSAIHNYIAGTVMILAIVSDMQRYKICQQFTTVRLLRSNIAILFQICKDTKFVSNSQPRLALAYCGFHCFRYAKIQNLSAIHNEIAAAAMDKVIVSDMQRYKICQQFTTANVPLPARLPLFQICKDTKFVSNSQQG